MTTHEEKAPMRHWLGGALFALTLAALAVAGPVRGAEERTGAPLAFSERAGGGWDGALAQNEAQQGDDLLDQFGPSDGQSEGGSGGGQDDLLDQFGESDPAESPAPADDGSMLEQFDAPAAEAKAEEKSGEGGLLPAWAALHGSASLQGAYNYAQEPPVPQRGWSKLRPVLRLDLTLDLPGTWEAQASGIAFHDYAYELRGEDEFTDEVLDQYQEEVELRELFVRGSVLPSLDLKEGRQIVVWGFADLIRVVDVLNPIENREPGLTDIEDARLPIWMTRLDYYFGDFALQGIAIHEIEFNKDPVYGSDFYPSDMPAPRERIPDSSLENTEYALSLVGYFSGWDLAFYYADFYDDTASLENVSTDPFIPDFRLRHQRLTMYGAAVNVALGNWLVKVESAYFDGLEFVALPNEEKARWDNLAGFDYTGITDTTITVEAVSRRILDYDKALEAAPDETREEQNQYAFSYRGDFWNQTLHLIGVWFFFGDYADDGGVQRYEVAYDVFDAFTVTGGVLIFQSAGDGNPLFQRVRDNDRAYFDVKYSF